MNPSLDAVKIIPPGDPCRLTHGDRAEALVLAATVRAAGVTAYEIAWWCNGIRHTAWVEPHEVEPMIGARTQAIGFGG